MEKIYYVHCMVFSGNIFVNERDVVIDAPPRANKFIGEPFIALRRWAKSRGAYKEII